MYVYINIYIYIYIEREREREREREQTDRQTDRQRERAQRYAIINTFPLECFILDKKKQVDMKLASQPEGL